MVVLPPAPSTTTTPSPALAPSPARLSDATHNRTITGIITDSLNPAESQADAAWISEGRSHTPAVARLNSIEPHNSYSAPSDTSPYTSFHTASTTPGVSTMTRPAPARAPGPCANSTQPRSSRAT